MRISPCIALSLFLSTASVLTVSVPASADDNKVGVVVMHGKGGSPDRYVNEFASSLARRGFEVANLEMPWSGRRQYDKGIDDANEEVNGALKAMRGKGATKLFIAGHSMGAAAAIQFGARFPIDGVIAIAPGHAPESAVLSQRFAAAVKEAKEAVAAGKGNQSSRFTDFEPHRGVYPVSAPAASYLSYFDPEGPMDMSRNVRSVPSRVPVLYIVPTGDAQQGFGRYAKAQFNSLAPNPLTRLYEPNSDHFGSPSASAGEVASWIQTVIGAGVK